MSDLSALQARLAELATVVSAVEAEVASLTAALTAEQPVLDAAAAEVAAAVTSLQALVPVAPAPVLRSVYTFDGDPATVDAAQWTLTAEESTDVPPRALYDYALDTAAGDKLGDGIGGVWHLYTGVVQPVPAVA